jgi:hypothetical protein
MRPRLASSRMSTRLALTAQTIAGLAAISPWYFAPSCAGL